MRLKTIILMSAIIFLVISTVYADEQGFANKNEMKNYCEKVIILIRDEKITEAFDLLENQWLLKTDDWQSLKFETIKQLDRAKERFGKVASFKLFKVEEIPEIGIKYIYVIKYEKHITRWVFIFYKPANKWFLNSFKWDDHIDELFKLK